jgi:hypothetical protein
METFRHRVIIWRPKMSGAKEEVPSTSGARPKEQAYPRSGPEPFGALASFLLTWWWDELGWNELRR